MGIRGVGAIPWDLIWRWAGPEAKFDSFKACSCLLKESMDLRRGEKSSQFISTSCHVLLNVFNKAVKFCRECFVLEVIVTQLQPFS